MDHLNVRVNAQNIIILFTMLGHFYFLFFTLTGYETQQVGFLFIAILFTTISSQTYTLYSLSMITKVHKHNSYTNHTYAAT
jgi:hypothetical protein